MMNYSGGLLKTMMSEIPNAPQEDLERVHTDYVEGDIDEERLEYRLEVLLEHGKDPEHLSGVGFIELVLEKNDLPEHEIDHIRVNRTLYQKLIDDPTLTFGDRVGQLSGQGFAAKIYGFDIEVDDTVSRCVVVPRS